jgi:transposase
VILLPRSVRIYMATAPVNLRKSFEGLSNEVRAVLAGDPISGHVFIFLNRRGTQVKLLLWTRGGFTIVHKRLERGRFTLPAKVSPGTSCVQLDAHELAMLLEGLVASPARGATRWTPRPATRPSNEIGTAV